jgi:PAS domain S-box-containing protein
MGDDGDVAYIIHRVEDVTDVVRLSEREKQARERSARVEERYSQLLDAAPDAMVIVGGDNRIEFVNRRAETLFGYDRTELLGEPLATLVPERLRGGHAAHEARFFSNPAVRPMGAGLELFGRHKDGSDVPIEVSLSPVRTGDTMVVSAAIRDISGRKQLEAAAKLTADRLASAVESIQDAFALFDSNHRLVLCNSVYRRFIGDTVPGTLVGRSFEELLGIWSREIDFPDDEARQRFREERLSLRPEPTATFDVRMSDGRSLRIADRRTPEGGIVKTIWDLTEDQRRARDLEKASAAKSDFLSSMSHELRTPLNAILGFAQLLQRDKKEPLSSRHQQRVRHILDGGGHLLRLINDVLDLSRIEAGALSISLEPVGVPEVIAEVLSTLEPEATRQGVQLGFEPLSVRVPPIEADRTRFSQILMNFGSNAIKYNRPTGTVHFGVSTIGSDIVRVSVRDSGIGIPANKHATLFQPFQRAGQEAGPIEGTGIGLVITKRLAELMHGDVGFHSVAGEGSTFWVDMPVRPSGIASRAPAPARAADSSRLAFNGHRLVLYVEDNPANVSFMRDLVGTFEDVEMMAAPTAEMGIELARERRPDAILMDINLPGMSGVEALKALRSTKETQGIPVIALTAAASNHDRERGLESGFYRYLTKPIKLDELTGALASALGDT